MRPERTLRGQLPYLPPVVVPGRGPIPNAAPLTRDVLYVGSDGQHVIEAPGTTWPPVVIQGSDGGRPAALYDTDVFPGHGIPLREQDREQVLDSGWPRIARGGKALGKTANIRYDRTQTKVQPAPSLLTVEGNDRDACQMCITLKTPQIIYETLTSIDDLALLQGAQNQQGGQDVDNATDDFPGSASPPVWAPITAKIEWGVGGTDHTAFVDWCQGMTVNVTASYVRVTPQILPDAANAKGTSALYTVGADVGPGWIPGTARRTVFVGSLVGNPASENPVPFPVPPFARRATVACWNSLATPVVGAGFLRFWQTANKAVGVGDCFFNTNQPIAFDIPNAASYFSVYNQSGSTLSFSVIFELSL